ncbi:MAG: class I SAM-dependent methyltransferase [Planctomycetaceae bacterium]|nr:class I SAM-dependent methyltransferase [Planctomycetaceae bacterium]
MTEIAYPLPEWATDEECRWMAQLRVTPQLLVDVATSPLTGMPQQKWLRERYPDDLVRAGLRLFEARQRAAAKFSKATEIWADRVSIEQSTAELVAQHKAKRFNATTWDLCCGMGGDAVAIAAQTDVTAVDSSPAMCLRTLWNGELYGVAERLQVRCADVHTLPGDVCGLVHIDPDRRPFSSGRMSRVEDYVPSLDFLLVLMSRVDGGAIKVGPASNFGGKFGPVETELISLHGECKEATLWFGSLMGTTPFRATVLPSGETIAGHPLDAVAEQSGLGAYVFDPDPAVVRAGLVDLLAERLNLRRLDPAEEYLTGDHPLTSPFVQTFSVLEELPNNDREIRHAVRRREWGAVEIKCRHVPIAAESVRKKLPLEGKTPGVIFYLRIAGKTRCVLAQRVPSSN